jgi:transcriptional regulator with XRE-family HTH domain
MEKTVYENLKRLRLKNNMSLSEAGKLMGMSAPGLLKYEKGEITPSIDRLAEFAKIYHTTIDEILDNGKSCEVKFDNFRCTSNATGMIRDKIKSILRRKIDNYFELLSISDIKLQNKFGVHMINNLQQAEILATKLRIFFTIPIDAPIFNLIYLLESNGIIVITIPRDEVSKNFIGFYELINNIPVIAVLEADNGYDQRFSVAKYLGELLIVAGDNKDEITTRFAESLLVPKEALIKEFGNSRSSIHFKEIELFSKIYKVSYKIIVKRLLMCKVITQSNAKYTNIYINKNDIKEEVYLEQAINYDKMLYKLVSKGHIKDVDRFI